MQLLSFLLSKHNLKSLFSWENFHEDPQQKRFLKKSNFSGKIIVKDCAPIFGIWGRCHIGRGLMGVNIGRGEGGVT